MKIDCRFKGLDFSPSLVSFIEDKFSKLEKFEIKPTSVIVTCSIQGDDKCVSVYLESLGSPVKCEAVGASFQESVDSVVTKLSRQMERKKGKVKRHRALGFSKFSRVNQPEAPLSDFELQLKRKTG